VNTLRDTFATYNQRIFPLQVLMAVVAILLVGLLFPFSGVTTTLLLRAFLSVTFGWIGAACLFVMAWGIILYPLTGYLLGHRYPRIPLFGAMPCPTNIFALGLLTAFASSRLEMIALYILSSMAVIGGVKAAFIGYGGERIYEDLALLLSGIFGFVIGLVVL
jgi:hypothetical protein